MSKKKQNIANSLNACACLLLASSIGLSGYFSISVISIAILMFIAAIALMAFSSPQEMPDYKNPQPARD